MEVIDGHERQPPGPGDRLRGGDPDEQGADQARPGRDADQAHILEGDFGLPQRLAHNGHHELEMPPRGDLRHDPAVLCVQVGLRGDDVRENPAVRRDYRRSRLVAGSLQP